MIKSEDVGSVFIGILIYCHYGSLKSLQEKQGSVHAPLFVSRLLCSREVGDWCEIHEKIKTISCEELRLQQGIFLIIFTWYGLGRQLTYCNGIYDWIFFSKVKIQLLAPNTNGKLSEGSWSTNILWSFTAESHANQHSSKQPTTPKTLHIIRKKQSKNLQCAYTGRQAPMICHSKCIVKLNCITCFFLWNPISLNINERTEGTDLLTW